MVDLELPVSLYGTHIGELVGDRGRSLLRWSADAEDHWGINSTAFSQSLTVGFSSSDQTESFFGALLPEGVHLDRLAKEAKVASDNLIGILHRVGADLAGALRVGDGRVAQEPEALSAEAVNRLLVRASGFLIGGGGSALPGFQRKLTLTRQDDRWWRGNGSLPSTHILKPVSAEDRPAAESENFLLGIGRHLGLVPFETWVEEIGNRVVLVIERYDRKRSGSQVERLHQEDAGQALGLPGGGNEKFEVNDSRASLRAVAGLLDRERTVFVPGRPDTEKLLRYTVLNVAGGNTDAHAKNFSLLHHEDGRIELAPFYDAAPLALAYGATQSLAMRINGKWQLPDVTREDLAIEAAGWGLDFDRATAVIDEALVEIIEATRVLTAHPSISAHIPGYVRGQAQNLAAGRPARTDSAIPLMAQRHIGTPQPR
jgi:serine/threonine-protein kinase HipA